MSACTHKCTIHEHIHAAQMTWLLMNYYVFLSIHTQHIAFFFEIMVKSMAQYLEIMDKMKVKLIAQHV